MSEELKHTAAAPQAAAKPAAVAPRPAAAAKPAAPAKPAVNELKPTVVEPAALRAEMVRLHDKEGMDFLLNLTGEDWMEEAEIDVNEKVWKKISFKDLSVTVKQEETEETE